MTKQVINVGTTANDRKGDSLRAAFQKVNANFTELYTALGADNSVFNPTDIDSDLIPAANNTYNIGSPSRQWQSMYVGLNTLYINNVPISLDNNGNLTVDGNLVAGGNANTGNWRFDANTATVTGATAQIGKNSSETITQEIPGGTVSQTTTNTSQVEIDASSIVITRSVTQVVDDGVLVATDEAGSVASIGNGSAYLKTYSEPAGPNNTQYAKAGTSGSYAYLESRQDDVGGYTLGGVVAGPGSVSITAHSTDDKVWLFDQDGNITLPAGGDIRDSTGTSVLGGNLGNLKIVGDTLATKDDPDTGGTGGFNLNLDPGGESNAFIQIPSVAGQTAGAQLSIGNNAVGNGGIRLSTAGGDYNFTDTQLLLPSNNVIKQNNSWTKTSTSTVAFNLLGTVVWSGSVDYISGAKLIIQVECAEVGDSTGWHSQVCEAIISSRGYANGVNGYGDPSMTVYGVVHTSANVLVTFSVQRNATTRLIEVVGTLTAAAAGAADLRIHSVELSTRD